MSRKKERTGRLRRLSPAGRWCLGILGLWVAVAVAAPLLANHKPLYVLYKGHSMFPAFSGEAVVRAGEENINLEQTDWLHFPCDRIFFPPVPWSPERPDYGDAGYTPPRFPHLLGTDKLGRDTLSGLIHGSRVSLLIGLGSMLLASLIGLGLGAFAGYFGDHTLKTQRGVALFTVAGAMLGFFYGFQVRAFVLQDSLAASTGAFLWQLAQSLVIFAAVVAAMALAGRLACRWRWLRQPVFIRADGMVSRLIEILMSLPRLVLIIAVAALARPSYFNLVVIIGLTAWTDIARLTRAEFLRLRHTEFVDAARVLGFSSRRIILRHALPNAVGPALTAIAFGVSGAILAESSLSFLGAGVPADVVTWGSMLAQAREHFDAWWLAVFPGLAIFFVVTLCNLLGESLREK